MVAEKNISLLRQSDVFLASFPRSGNTWVMNLLYFLDIFVLEGYQHDLSLDHVRELPESKRGMLPGLASLQEKADGLTFPFRVVKTHSLPSQLPPHKSIYLCRDGRDAVWSYFHFCRRFHAFEGTFEQFLKGPDQPARSWASHVQAWIGLKKKWPICCVYYEKLLENPVAEIQSVLAFLGIHREEADIELAVGNCHFGKLKESELRKSSEGIQESNMRFFRQGNSGQWKDAFSAVDTQLFMAEAGDALRQMGYVTTPVVSV